MIDYSNSLAIAEQYWNNKSATAKTLIDSVEQNKRPQKMRYESFIRAHDLDNRSVLDVGCGTGDLYNHFIRRGLETRYSGTDISENMINICQQRFPGQDFRHIDAIEIDVENKYDYVVSFGIHNIKVNNAWEILQAYTKKQYDLCSIAAHISILTDRYSGFDPHIQSWSAERLLTFSLGITPYVEIRHSYLPNDFSVTLYREPLIDTLPDLLLDYE